MANSNKKKNWLLPTTLILFILSVITLSLMAVVTYAWRNEDPTHLLTFENEKLTWDENTEVGENGVAHLSFFNTYYQNVNSENGDNVFAPGTEQDTLIRLKNNSDDVWGFWPEKSGCPKILIAWDRTILCLCSTVRHEASSGYPSAALGSRRAR